MRESEFKRAFDIANDESVDLEDVDISIIDGYGLPEFHRVTVTVYQIAKEMRNHRYFNGGWDMESINTIRTAGRTKFCVVG